MTILLEFDNLLRVDLEFTNILIETEEVLAGALKPKAFVVIWESISNLLYIVLIGKEMNQLLIDYKWFFEAILKQHSLSFDELRRWLDNFLIIITQRGVEQL